MRETLFHRIFRRPYTLHASVKSPESRKKQTVVFLHGLGSSAPMWQDVLPHITNARVITIDLLGFGRSPKPSWGKYTTRRQIRSIHKTLKKLGYSSNIILVGHSLGSLVAIEYAYTYQKDIKQLILSSPPLYKEPEQSTVRENMYRRIYKFIRTNPITVLKGSRLLRANKGMDINKHTLPAYVKSLEESIENQNAPHRLEKLECPIDIIYGRFDILLVTKNLKEIAAKNHHIRLHAVAAGHEIIGQHYKKVLQILLKTLHIKR